MADVNPGGKQDPTLPPAVPTISTGVELASRRRFDSWVTVVKENRLFLGSFAIAIGIFLVVVATQFLTNAGGEVRVPLGIFGLVVVYFGLDSVFKSFWGERFETGFWLSVAWIVLICLVAIFADLLPLSEARDAGATLRSEDENLLSPDLLSKHPGGTDRQKLDILGGIIYGARISLQIVLLAVAIGMTVGGVIGVTAGYFQKWVDTVIGVFTDAILAFPPLVFLLVLATVLPRTPVNISLALSALGIPVYIRLARANTLVFVQREFVLAAIAMGAKRSRIIFKELVPNVALPLASYAFIIMAVLIVAEASLSFLGLGVQRPDPTWGNMIAAGQFTFDAHPHLLLLPSIGMFLTVFSLNLVGEKAIRRWDPRVSQL